MFLPRSKTQEVELDFGSMEQEKLPPSAREFITAAGTWCMSAQASTPGQGWQAVTKFFTVVLLAHQYTLGLGEEMMNCPPATTGSPPLEVGVREVGVMLAWVCLGGTPVERAVTLGESRGTGLHTTPLLNPGLSHPGCSREAV
jgi:hypothetical protein